MAGALAFYTISQYLMNHSTTWDAATKASVFVAAGTLLLAVATAWSVWETRAVIRGEDRRLQQSLAPYLTFRFQRAQPDLGDEEITGFQVTNSGYGLARDVAISVKAWRTQSQTTAA